MALWLQNITKHLKTSFPCEWTPAVINTSIDKIPTLLLLLLTVELDSQFIGRPSEGNAAGGG